MTPTVSVVCGVMDRSSPLAVALPSWLACPEVTEVVLVDWSSTESLPDSVRDPRVRVVTVSGQRYWHASKCHNLGVRLARGDLVLRLDADDVFVPGPDGDRLFFEVHEHAGDSSFFRVDQTHLRHADDVHLAGVVYARRKDILGVGGYNERVRTYGHEDDDLVARLAASGARVLTVDCRTLHHLPHADESRVARTPLGDYPDLTVKPRDASWVWNVGVVARCIEHGKNVASERPWGPGDATASFEVVWSSAGRAAAREVARSSMTAYAGRDGLVSSPAGLTLVCGVMDRSSDFALSLDTWVTELFSREHVRELVVVDWSSSPAESYALLRALEAYPWQGAASCVLGRVRGEATWQPGPCFNLGLHIATSALVLKLDADVRAVRVTGEPRRLFADLLPRLFADLLPGTFKAGDWRAARREDERHLSGLVCARRADLVAVNGWNERVATYGYDDCDLYDRLVASGLRRELACQDAFRHAPHGDDVRLRRQPGRVSSCLGEAEANRALCEGKPWKRDDALVKWRVGDGGPTVSGVRVYDCCRAE